MDIRMGVPVEARDGRAGRVERLVFDTRQNRLVAVVVAEAGILPHDVIMPVTWIEHAGEDALRVRASVSEISRLPPCSLAQYAKPPEQWLPPAGADAAQFLFPRSPYAVGAFTAPGPHREPPPEPVEDLPSGTDDLALDSAVFCLDGPAGRVDRV